MDETQLKLDQGRLPARRHGGRNWERTLRVLGLRWSLVFPCRHGTLAGSRKLFVNSTLEIFFF